MWKENHYIEVCPSGLTVNHYKRLGYDTVAKRRMMVLQDHLPETSKTDISLICDKCGKEFEQLRIVYKNKKEKNKFLIGDYCLECRALIGKELNNKCGNSKANYYEDYIQKFLDRGYTILTEEIPNKKIKVQYICAKHIGRVAEITLADFDSGRGCMLCGKESMSKKQGLTIKEVKNRFDNKGLILLSNEYVNSTTEMPYICKKHPNKIQSTTMSNFNGGAYTCNYCAAESMTGDGNPSWKGGNSDLISAIRGSLSGWARESLKNSGFKCVISHVTNGKRHVHHYKESFNSILTRTLIDLNFEVKDIICEYETEEYVSLRDLVISRHYESGFGIVLADKLHTLFHRLYGYHNNTPQQFDEFTLRYKLGEFNDTKVLPKKLWANNI